MLIVNSKLIPFQETGDDYQFLTFLHRSRILYYIHKLYRHENEHEDILLNYIQAKFLVSKALYSICFAKFLLSEQNYRIFRIFGFLHENLSGDKRFERKQSCAF